MEKITKIALKAAEGKYKNLTKNAPFAICRLLPNGKCDYVNDEFVRQSGFTLEEYDKLSKKEMNDIIYPEDNERVNEQYNSWVKKGRKGVKNIVYRSFTKNKELKWLNSFHYADYDKDGQLAAINQIYIDITDQKNAENSLRRSEELFRNIFEKSPVGIELFDSNGYMISANKADLKMFGISKFEDIKDFNLFSDTTFDENTKQKLRKGKSISYVKEYDFSGGNICVCDRQFHVVVAADGCAGAGGGVGGDIARA